MSCIRGDFKISAMSKPFDTTSRRRVLVVEDDWLIALSLQEMLQDAGCDVVGPVGDVTAALPLCQGGAIDAAILDYWLRDATAKPLADVLSAHGVPFALTTGFGVDVIPKDHGAACIVAKPYTLHDVREMLAHISLHGAASAGGVVPTAA